MDLPLFRLFFVFILMLFSAFFSGSETAIFSYGKIGLSELGKENVLLSKKLKYLLSNPSRLLFSILLGNESVNVMLSTVIASIVSQYYAESDWETATIVSILIATPLVLVFSEITPKAIAIKAPKQMTLLTIRPLYLLNKLIEPGIAFFNKVLRINPSTLEENNDKLSELEFINMVETSAKEEKIKDYEKKLIKNVFILNDTTAEKIMTPKEKVFYVNQSSDFKTILKIVRDSEYSRIPVLDDSSTYVVGVIYSKKLLSYLEKTKISDMLDFDIKEMIMPVSSVPRKIKLLNLLKFLKKIKQHLAIVVNEHGDMLGLITMEDVLEELFGEIKDERDIKDEC